MPTKNIKKGRVHSFETFGTLDGPGVRFVVFLEGCGLCCKYCHNIDMLDMKDYMLYTPQELLNEVKPYKSYFKYGDGGVTISGGDPIIQPDFVYDFFKLCKKAGIHTTIDTSLFTNKDVIDKLLPVVDLWMVSLKHFDNKKHEWLTCQSNVGILENVKYLSKKKARLWLRQVILPGYTDTRGNLKALREFLHSVRFELVELLPYHTFGIYKWKKLGKKYELGGVKPPRPAKVLKIKKMLEKEGFKVLLNE
ncbi:MAG: pyruvate formate-lyase-activating protein [Patescibacteria group bacterium]|nr:pyruvate formate lyase-activating protein [Patescibacteria group bacterium]